jgi:hypothetical protein
VLLPVKLAIDGPMELALNGESAENILVLGHSLWRVIAQGRVARS